MAGKSFVVAITGASGAVYGLNLTGELLKRGFDVDLIISPTAFIIIEEELGLKMSAASAEASVTAFLKDKGILTDGAESGVLTYYSPMKLAAPPASGSSLKRVMVVIPCSMGTLGRIASGISKDLIDRAADCILKERGTLVLVPRETPLNDIHLENMLKLSRAGAVILPAMPAFYTKPESVGDMVDFIVGKILDMLGIENEIYKRWIPTGG